MAMKNWRIATMLAGAFVAGFGAHALMAPAATAHAAANRVFEIRTYTATPGKFDAMKARFRDHTLKLFSKHGMTNVGYFVPLDAPLAGNTLIYVLAHSSREEAKKSWAGFQADPDWVKAKSESEKDGKIVDKVTSVFADPADFSPLK